MTKKASVSIQKGKIDPSPKTMKTMSYKEKVSEGKQRHDSIKGMQTCGLREPKK